MGEFSTTRNTKSQKKQKAWNTGNTVCVLFIMLLLLAQPVYSASVLGEFGKVSTSEDKTQAEQQAIPIPEVGEQNSDANGVPTIAQANETDLENLPEQSRKEAEEALQAGLNITIIRGSSSPDVEILAVAASAPINQQTTPNGNDQNISSQISLSDWKFAKEVGGESEQWEPKRVTSVFSKNDYIAHLWVKFVDIYEAHSLTWKWYDTSQNFYADCSANLAAPPSGYYWTWYKASCGVYVKDRVPASNPGVWNARLYLDGDNKQVDSNFVIKYEYKETKMVKGVDGDGNPGQQTTEFSASDDAAYTWFRMEKVADPLQIKWDWYDPDGALYATATHSSKDPGTDKYWDGYNAWSWIPIKNTNAASKCGNWQVNASIDDQFKYSQGFTIKDCAPPVECKAEALEAWVGKDGEIYNNIKTHHKFINNEGESLNYSIQFELFGPDGASVGSTSNSGKLDPGWWVVWWVQYGVPSGGWKPGSYTSRASIDGYCGSYRVQKSNEAYPKIPEPAPPPGGGATDFCDGAINVRVSDKYGNSLQSVKVYLEDSLEGTTSAEGERNIVIADNGCGRVHAVKAVCPNDAFCDEKTTTIDYDGDASSLGFVCKCPGIVPGLDIEASTDSFKYFKDYDIKLNALIKKADSSKVANSLLTIYDPFLGATKFFSLAEGALSYGSKATLGGLQAFFLSGYKQGFLPGFSKIKVVVEDFTGKVTVQATHKDGSSLKSALVYLGDQFKGATDSTGSKTFSAEKGRVSVLALKCPGAKTDAPYCSGKDVTVTDNNFIPLSCDCGPEGTNKKGTILLQLKSKNCPPEFQTCPIGNALVSVDGKAIGYTPVHGFIELPDLKYGNRKVEITGLITDNEDDETPELKRNIISITVDTPFEHMPLELRSEDFQTIKGAEAESLMSAGNASEQFVIIPILIWVAFTAWDWKQKQDCEKKYDYDPLVADAECWDERLFLGSNFVPLGTVFSKVGKGIKGIVGVLRLVDGKWTRELVEVTKLGEAFQHAVRLFDRVHNVYKVVSEYGGRALGYVVRKTGLKEVIIIVNHVESVILRDWDAAAKAVQLKFLGKDLQIGDTILHHSDYAGKAFDKVEGEIKKVIGEAYAEKAFKELAQKVDPGIAVTLMNKETLKPFMTSGDNVIETTNYRFIFQSDNSVKIKRISSGREAEIDRLFDMQGKPVIVEAKFRSKITYGHKEDIEPDALMDTMKATSELYSEKILKNEIDEIQKDLLEQKLPQLTEQELKQLTIPQYVVAGPSDVVDNFVKKEYWKKLTADVMNEGFERPLPLRFGKTYGELNDAAVKLYKGG